MKETTVRTRGHSLRVVALTMAVTAVLGATGCSSGGGSTDSSSGAVTLAPPVTGESEPATLPADIEPGSGALALGPRLVRFTVTRCSLKPIIDPDGVALVIDVAGDDGQGGALDVSRKTTAGGTKAPPTTTDTISYAPAGATQLIAQRIELGGVVRDPRDPAATASLLTLDGTTVRGSGLFGGIGAAAASAELVYGELRVTCTQDALTVPSSPPSSSG